jgi:hypothetical protein
MMAGQVSSRKTHAEKQQPSRLASVLSGPRKHLSCTNPRTPDIAKVIERSECPLTCALLAAVCAQDVHRRCELS